METPPQNLAHRQYNYINRHETPVNQLQIEHEDFLRPAEKYEFLLKANQKGRMNPQNSEKENVSRLIQEMRKQSKYLDESNWMYELSKDLIPADLIQNTI